MLEIKPTRTQIEQQVCDLIRQYKMTDQVVVASIYDDIISRFRGVCPEVATSAAFGEVTLFVFSEKSHLNHWVSPFYESLQGPYDPTGLYDNVILTKTYLRDAHARNVKVEPWSDDPTVMQYYIDIGVDGLITDYPDVLLKLLDRK